MRVSSAVFALVLVACQSRQPAAQVGSAEGRDVQANIERWIAAQRIDGLCSKDEQIVFQCVAGRDRIAVCGGSLSKQVYLQFRQQDGGKLIKYPESIPAPHSHFSIESPWRTMGGEEHLTFQREGLHYDVYSIAVGMSASRRTKAEVRDGLTISDGERVVSDVRCSATEVPLDSAAAENKGAAHTD